ncbi:hypothetical protein CTheo_1818 [Ceratobasidium theobromae]|uniref:Uncharacterized protein n=1 Tax=Ceratobasidium theobromae TaxID=1582974 RepID=A0A5N5QSX2_9AGAM|nr:hypothetical protein CTheo_1818 [Ceratobasidium theobromae]
MTQADRSEVQKALLPPHRDSQTSLSSDSRTFEALTMDHSAPFNFYSFMDTGRLTVAMESHAVVWDVFPGARCADLFQPYYQQLTRSLPNSVTRFFDGTAELHAISQPTALMHLDSFEITFQSSDPTCCVNEISTSRSSRINKYILFETPERDPHACIARCRFRIVIPETLFPWNGEQAQFRICVCALFNLNDPDRPGYRMLQRGPGYIHKFSLQLRASPRRLPLGP